MVAHSEERKEVKIVDANVDWHNWRKRLRESFRYRYVLQNLVKRDVQVRYRNSVLGVIWSLLNPLLIRN